MSYHIYDAWQWSDGVNDHIVTTIAEGIKANKWGNHYHPACFAILTLGDQLLYNVAVMIDKAIGSQEPITDAYLEGFIPVDFEYHKEAVELTRRILKELDLFDKVITVEKCDKEQELADLKKIYSPPGPTEHFEEVKKQQKDMLRKMAESGKAN